MFGKRKAAFKKRPPDYFVHGIVAADVLTHRRECPLRAEYRGGVQAAGLLEHRLRPAQSCRKAAEQFRVNAKFRIGRLDAARADGFNSGLSTQPAARGGHEISTCSIGVD